VPIRSSGGVKVVGATFGSAWGGAPPPPSSPLAPAAAARAAARRERSALRAVARSERCALRSSGHWCPHLETVPRPPPGAVLGDHTAPAPPPPPPLPRSLRCWAAAPFCLRSRLLS
jgi:hypothetical protein